MNRKQLIEYYKKLFLKMACILFSIHKREENTLFEPLLRVATINLRMCDYIFGIPQNATLLGDVVEVKGNILDAIDNLYNEVDSFNEKIKSAPQSDLEFLAIKTAINNCRQVYLDYLFYKEVNCH